MSKTFMVSREEAEKTRFAVRAAIGAASAVLHDKATAVPTDLDIALRIWLAFTGDLMEHFGVETLRELLESASKLIEKNRDTAAALERGATHAVVQHPEGCECGKCSP